MARKRYKPEEIVGKLRQAEVLHGQGMSMADAIRQLGITHTLSRSPRSGCPRVVRGLLEPLVAVATRLAATRMQPDRNFQQLWTFTPSATT